jgi:putative ABC transport system permease protein
VGLSTGVPVSGYAMGMPFLVQEHPGEEHGGSAPFTIISPGYFETLRIPVLKGRSFMEQDRFGMPRVTIISRAFARRYFRQEDPIGKHLLIKAVLPFNQGVGAPVPCEIVGVVGDVKLSGLVDDKSDEIYAPYPQSPWSVMDMTVRTSGTPLSMVNPIQKAIWELDGDLPFTYVSTMDTIVSKATSDPRFRTLLLSGFAVVALMLASVGLYGVLSYSVTQRTNEIGIRIALGARRGDMLALILRQGVLFSLSGVAIGWAGAFALTRAMSSLLFETSATDQRLFAFVSVILTSVGFIACYLPARRATKVDPMVALRCE